MTKKYKIYFEIKKGKIIKNVSFFTTKEQMNIDIEYWKMVHLENGWNVQFLGYAEVR